jgi:hypothetical protein
MIRIRGHIGAWPVDLSLELGAEDWAQLGAQLSADVTLPPPAASAAEGDQHLWQTALQLIREAGQMDGLHLLKQLAALAGSEQAGKRLLVRMRHCPQVRVESAGDTARYCWQGEPPA